MAHHMVHERGLATYTRVDRYTWLAAANLGNHPRRLLCRDILLTGGRSGIICVLTWRCP
jgi:hypothetical protein